MGVSCLRTAAAVLLFLALGVVPAHAQSGLDQRAVVFIKTKCEDPQTGVIAEPQGTGFIVEKSGYILTAHHVVSCWDPEKRRQLDRLAIQGRIGSRWHPDRWTLDFQNSDKQSDVAILKLLGRLSHDHPTLKMCSLRKPASAKSFLAAGFPEGKPYRVLPGTFGSPDAGGGRWAVASDFHYGMSGGPVVHNGFVVGLIKGGSKNVAALSEITPIYRAKSLLDSEVGLTLSECSARGPDNCDGATVALGSGGSTCIRPGSGESFRDCPECPEMVVVPAGSFMMGTPKSAWNHWANPPHRVTIARAFAVGRFEVTRGEFAAFVRESGHNVGDKCWTDEGHKAGVRTGRSFRNPGYAQTDRHPAVCVSWNDTQAYVRWLSQKTGKSYRLLSEAEWEYVARAGTKTRYHFGNDKSDLCAYGNGADMTGKFFSGWSEIANCRDGYVNTAPVGSFKSNAFKLHDLHGNVKELVQDCWNESYNGAPPTNGSAWTTGNCGLRVDRGGSWYSDPKYIESAFRFYSARDSRSYTVGFRVGRTF